MANRKPAGQVTNRALRYRANHPDRRPPGPKVCAFCGSRQNVELHHVDGHEENSNPENLAWACRSCNTTIGVAMKRAGIGRRTHQFNPEGARNLAQWLKAVLSVKGETSDMTVRQAVEMIRATPAARRSQFAGEIWSRRREHGTDKQIPF